MYGLDERYSSFCESVNSEGVSDNLEMRLDLETQVCTVSWYWEM